MPEANLLVYLAIKFSFVNLMSDINVLPMNGFFRLDSDKWLIAFLANSTKSGFLEGRMADVPLNMDGG
jgi:hypothetical protein